MATETADDSLLEPEYHSSLASCDEEELQFSAEDQLSPVLSSRQRTCYRPPPTRTDQSDDGEGRCLSAGEVDTSAWLQEQNPEVLARLQEQGVLIDKDTSISADATDSDLLSQSTRDPSKNGITELIDTDDEDVAGLDGVDELCDAGTGTLDEGVVKSVDAMDVGQTAAVDWHSKSDAVLADHPDYKGSLQAYTTASIAAEEAVEAASPITGRDRESPTSSMLLLKPPLATVQAHTSPEAALPEIRLEPHLEHDDEEEEMTNSEESDPISAYQTPNELTERLVQERDQKREAKKLLDQLQKNYDKLLARYAQAEVTIDQLRCASIAGTNDYSTVPSAKSSQSMLEFDHDADASFQHRHPQPLHLPSAQHGVSASMSEGQMYLPVPLAGSTPFRGPRQPSSEHDASNTTSLGGSLQCGRAAEAEDAFLPFQDNMCQNDFSNEDGTLPGELTERRLRESRDENDKHGIMADAVTDAPSSPLPSLDQKQVAGTQPNLGTTSTAGMAQHMEAIGTTSIAEHDQSSSPFRDSAEPNVKFVVGSSAVSSDTRSTSPLREVLDDMHKVDTPGECKGVCDQGTNGLAWLGNGGTVGGTKMEKDDIRDTFSGALEQGERICHLLEDFTENVISKQHADASLLHTGDGNETSTRLHAKDSDSELDKPLPDVSAEQDVTDLVKPVVENDSHQSSDSCPEHGSSLNASLSASAAADDRRELRKSRRQRSIEDLLSHCALHSPSKDGKRPISALEKSGTELTTGLSSAFDRYVRNVWRTHYHLEEVPGVVCTCPDSVNFLKPRKRSSTSAEPPHSENEREKPDLSGKIGVVLVSDDQLRQRIDLLASDDFDDPEDVLLPVSEKVDNLGQDDLVLTDDEECFPVDGEPQGLEEDGFQQVSHTDAATNKDSVQLATHADEKTLSVAEGYCGPTDDTTAASANVKVVAPDNYDGDGVAAAKSPIPLAYGLPQSVAITNDTVPEPRSLPSRLDTVSKQAVSADSKPVVQLLAEEDMDAIIVLNRHESPRTTENNAVPESSEKLVEHYLRAVDLASTAENTEVELSLLHADSCGQQIGENSAVDLANVHETVNELVLHSSQDEAALHSYQTPSPKDEKVGTRKLPPTPYELLDSTYFAPSTDAVPTKPNLPNRRRFNDMFKESLDTNDASVTDIDLQSSTGHRSHGSSTPLNTASPSFLAEGSPVDSYSGSEGQMAMIEETGRLGDAGARLSGSDLDGSGELQSRREALLCQAQALQQTLHEYEALERPLHREERAGVLAHLQREYDELRQDYDHALLAGPNADYSMVTDEIETTAQHMDACVQRLLGIPKGHTEPRAKVERRNTEKVDERSPEKAAATSSSLKEEKRAKRRDLRKSRSRFSRGKPDELRRNFHGLGEQAIGDQSLKSRDILDQSDNARLIASKCCGVCGKENEVIGRYSNWPGMRRMPYSHTGEFPDQRHRVALAMQNLPAASISVARSEPLENRTHSWLLGQQAKGASMDHFGPTAEKFGARRRGSGRERGERDSGFVESEGSRVSRWPGQHSPMDASRSAYILANDRHERPKPPAPLNNGAAGVPSHKTAQHLSVGGDPSHFDSNRGLVNGSLETLMPGSTRTLDSLTSAERTRAPYINPDVRSSAPKDPLFVCRDCLHLSDEGSVRSRRLKYGTIDRSGSESRDESSGASAAAGVARLSAIPPCHLDAMSRHLLNGPQVITGVRPNEALLELGGSDKPKGLDKCKSKQAAQPQPASSHHRDDIESHRQHPLPKGSPEILSNSSLLTVSSTHLPNGLQQSTESFERLENMQNQTATAMSPTRGMPVHILSNYRSPIPAGSAEERPSRTVGVGEESLAKSSASKSSQVNLGRDESLETSTQTDQQEPVVPEASRDARRKTCAKSDASQAPTTPYSAKPGQLVNELDGVTSEQPAKPPLLQELTSLPLRAEVSTEHVSEASALPASEDHAPGVLPDDGTNSPFAPNAACAEPADIKSQPVHQPPVGSVQSTVVSSHFSHLSNGVAPSSPSIPAAPSTLHSNVSEARSAAVGNVHLTTSELDALRQHQDAHLAAVNGPLGSQAPQGPPTSPRNPQRTAVAYTQQGSSVLIQPVMHSPLTESESGRMHTPPVHPPQYQTIGSMAPPLFHSTPNRQTLPTHPSARVPVTSFGTQMGPHQPPDGRFAGTSPAQLVPGTSDLQEMNIHKIPQIHVRTVTQTANDGLSHPRVPVFHSDHPQQYVNTEHHSPHLHHAAPFPNPNAESALYVGTNAFPPSGVAEIPHHDRPHWHYQGAVPFSSQVHFTDNPAAAHHQSPNCRHPHHTILPPAAPAYHIGRCAHCGCHHGHHHPHTSASPPGSSQFHVNGDRQQSQNARLNISDCIAREYTKKQAFKPGPSPVSKRHEIREYSHRSRLRHPARERSYHKQRDVVDSEDLSDSEYTHSDDDGDMDSSEIEESLVQALRTAREMRELSACMKSTLHRELSSVANSANSLY